MSLTGLRQKELEVGNLNDRGLKGKVTKDAIVDFTLAFAIVLMIYVISQIL